MFTGNEDHGITFEAASTLTKRYRELNPTSIKGGFFGKAAIQTLLNQDGCVGIRIYLGLNKDEILKFVLVGVDEDENDLIGDDYNCMEYSIPCPNQCGSADCLNS